MAKEGDDATTLGIPLTIGEPDVDDLVGEDPNAAAADDPLAAARAEWEAERAQLRQDFEQREQYYRNTMDRLITQAPGQGGQGGQDPNDIGLNLEDLPDPVEDRAGFNRELQSRLTSTLQRGRENIASQVTTEAERNRQINDLWSGFRTVEPELSKKDALAGVAAQQVLQRNGGFDWAVGNREAFYEQVAQRMRDELGIESEGQPAAGKPKAGKGNPTRTGGVKGGSRAAGGVTSQPAKSDGFVSQLKKDQAALGLY